MTNLQMNAPSTHSPTNYMDKKIQNIFQLIFAFPFTVLYGLGISILNGLYQVGILKSVRFDVPIIVVGNLSTGGTGKTPHVEYLIEVLRPYLNVATLSRGYKRKSKGFLGVAPNADAQLVGDEPLQFKRKFRDVYVTVSESRTVGVMQIMGNAPNTQVILMDDGYQHRAIEPGFVVLLTTFDKPYFKDFLLPGGNLREWRSGDQRANLIIVTKSPKTLTRDVADQYLERIQPLKHQSVYFSYYDYGMPYYFFDAEQSIELTDELDVILICGLANSDYLVKYLDETVNFARILDFPDHYYYKSQDLENLKAQYEQHDSLQKIILTTEKDAVRLELHRDFIVQHELPIFILPVQVHFHFGEGRSFENAIKQFLLGFKI